MENIEVLFKNNKLIKTRHDLSLADNRIMQKIFIEVQKQKSNIVELSREDLGEILKSSHKIIKGSLEETFDALEKNSIKIRNGKDWTICQLIASVDYKSKANFFIVEVPEKLLKILYSYKKDGFTPVNVVKYATLRSTSTQRLYELIRAELWKKQKYVTLNVDAIREYMMMENKYNSFRDFRRRIIEPAFQELENKNLLKITDIQYVKTGKYITEIKFKVTDFETTDYNYEGKKKLPPPEVPEEPEASTPEEPEASTPEEPEAIVEEAEIKTTEKPPKTIELEMVTEEDKEYMTISQKLKLSQEIFETYVKELQDLNVNNISTTHFKALASRHGISKLNEAYDKLIEGLALGEIDSNKNMVSELVNIMHRDSKEAIEKAIVYEETTLEEIADNTPNLNKNFVIFLEQVKNHKSSVTMEQLQELSNKYGETKLCDCMEKLVEIIEKGKPITNIYNYLSVMLKNYKNQESISCRKNNYNDSKASSFANFTQREYDYDKLEKQLLGWDDEDEDEDE